MLPVEDADCNWNTDDSMSAIDEYDIVKDGVDAGHAAVESMIAMSYARTPLLQSAVPHGQHHTVDDKCYTIKELGLDYLCCVENDTLLLTDETHLNHHHRMAAVQMCTNCFQRQVGTALKKCGFEDWCSKCDASLWATNPAAANADVLPVPVVPVLPFTVI